MQRIEIRFFPFASFVRRSQSLLLDKKVPNRESFVAPSGLIENLTSTTNGVTVGTPVSTYCVPVLSKYRMRVALAGIGNIYATLQTDARNVRAVQSRRTEMQIVSPPLKSAGSGSPWPSIHVQPVGPVIVEGTVDGTASSNSNW